MEAGDPANTPLPRDEPALRHPWEATLPVRSPLMVSVPDFLRLVVDPIRLAVLGAAAKGPVDIEAVAGAMGTDEGRVQREVGRLAGAGLLTADLRLDVEALRDVARALPGATPIDAVLLEGPWAQDEVEVLSRFFSGRRLTSIPSSRAKRRLVLERLAQEFEPGLRYQEREVDFTLQMFFADYAALRRYLVDEGFMTRADGVYWRTGGRVAPPGE